MRNFKVSKLHLFLILMLDILIVFLLIRSFDRDINMEIILLLVSVLVGVIYFVLLLRREVIIDGNVIHVKGLTKTKTIELDKVDFIQSLSALGRYVVIMSDGKTATTITSLISKFDILINEIKLHLSPDVANRLDSFTATDIKRKATLFTILMVALNVVAIYAVVAK